MGYPFRGESLSFDICQSSKIFLVEGLPFQNMEFLILQERVEKIKSHYENGVSALSTF